MSCESLRFLIAFVPRFVNWAESECYSFFLIAPPVVAACFFFYLSWWRVVPFQVFWNVLVNCRDSSVEQWRKPLAIVHLLVVTWFEYTTSPGFWLAPWTTDLGDLTFEKLLWQIRWLWVYSTVTNMLNKLSGQPESYEKKYGLSHVFYDSLTCHWAVSNQWGRALDNCTNLGEHLVLERTVLSVRQIAAVGKLLLKLFWRKMSEATSRWFTMSWRCCKPLTTQTSSILSIGSNLRWVPFTAIYQCQ